MITWNGRGKNWPQSNVRYQFTDVLRTGEKHARTWIRLVSVRADTRTRDLPNKKQECMSLTAASWTNPGNRDKDGNIVVNRTSYGSDPWIVNSALAPSRLDAEFKKDTEDIFEVKPEMLVEFTRNYQAPWLLLRRRLCCTDWDMATPLRIVRFDVIF